MTVYECRGRCHSKTSELLVSPDGSTICLISPSTPDYPEPAQEGALSLHSKMSEVVRRMSRAGSGLDVKDRVWLKLNIPDAFTGTNLVRWLYRNVHGFSDRREARKYAIGLLKGGFVVSAVNNLNFSEQRYYQISPHLNHRGSEHTKSPDQLGPRSSPYGASADQLGPRSSTFYSNPCFSSPPSSPCLLPASLSRQSSKTSSSKSRNKTWQVVRNKLIRSGSIIMDSFHSNAV